MKKYPSIILFTVLASLLMACNKTDEPENTAETTDVVAFDGADGGGKYVTGGRGSTIYVVNSLDDDVTSPQPGTLRFALTQKGKRVVIFNISGNIDLDGDMEIKEGDLTVFGQSAPGDGICISGYPVIVKADNVILRFLRFRLGDERGREADALSVGEGHKDILIDHCSCSWSTDECVSIYGVSNLSVQYCFITESLRKSVHSKNEHGYGGIWGGKNATYHHNLLAHHDSRNPRFDHEYVDRTCHGPLDYVNNVVYNWGSNPAYGGEGVGEVRKINFVNNYYKPGPATSNKSRMVEPWTSCNNCSPLGSVVPPKIYLTGNILDGSSTVTADNWQGSSVKTDAVKASSRWTDDLTVLDNEESAEKAYETVLTKAGCSLHRDAIDERIVSEVRNGTYTYTGSKGSKNGLIDSPSDVHGREVEYKTYDKPVDTDGDGIPDKWEDEHGLDKNNFMDAREISVKKPYMNIEVYLNELVAHLY